MSRTFKSTLWVPLLIIVMVAMLLGSRDEYAEPPSTPKDALDAQGNQLGCTKAMGDVITFCKDSDARLSAGSLNVQKRLFFGSPRLKPTPDAADNNTDPYHMEKVANAANQSSLRLTINDDPQEVFEIWGDSCRSQGGCAGPGAARHRFGADGHVSHAGPACVGSTACLDAAKRGAADAAPLTVLSSSSPGGTSGRLLANVLPGGGAALQADALTDGRSRSSSLKVNPAGGNVGIGSAQEPAAQLHVAGDTRVDRGLSVGQQVCIQDVCVDRARLQALVSGPSSPAPAAAQNVNVQGRLHFRDPTSSAQGSGANNTDTYFMEKVLGGNNQSSLRLTINDDADETFEIWGNSCGAGNCGGAGTMQHSFRADGTAVHKRLQLGNKFLLSGVGDAHSQTDDWLRLFGTDSRAGNYFGGFAAGRLWSSTGQLSGSDARLKHGIRSLTDAEVDKLGQLQARAYRLRADGPAGPLRFGFVAQEAERVYPDLVSRGPDGHLSLSYQDVVPLLVEKVRRQEQELRRVSAALVKKQAQAS